MVEGFRSGTGQPPTSISDVAIEVPQPQLQSRRRRVVAWIVFGAFVLGAAGFGLRYYLSHRTFFVSGEILYKPEVETQDGSLETAMSVMPVQGAEVIVYAGFWEPPNDNDFSAYLRDRMFPVGPRWRDQVANWNQRLHDCWQAMSHTNMPREVARTYTDAIGQFTLRLKPGVYYLFASSDVPSFVMDDEGKLSPATGYAYWRERLDVTGETKLVSAQPSCSP